jgi:hypothetical protein
MNKEIRISPSQIAQAVDNLLDEKIKLQQRIEKAIKYIENKEIDTLHFNSKDFLDTSIAGELLEILKGEDNDR